MITKLQTMNNNHRILSKFHMKSYTTFTAILIKTVPLLQNDNTFMDFLPCLKKGSIGSEATNNFNQSLYVLLTKFDLPFV